MMSKCSLMTGNYQFHFRNNGQYLSSFKICYWWIVTERRRRSLVFEHSLSNVIEFCLLGMGWDGNTDAKSHKPTSVFESHP
jgi:hypothetical protein